MISRSNEHELTKRILRIIKYSDYVGQHLDNFGSVIFEVGILVQLLLVFPFDIFVITFCYRVRQSANLVCIWA